LARPGLSRTGGHRRGAPVGPRRWPFDKLKRPATGRDSKAKPWPCLARQGCNAWRGHRDVSRWSTHSPSLDPSGRRPSPSRACNSWTGWRPWSHPPSRRHRHRYHGVLAGNAPLHAVVTARAGFPMARPVSGPGSYPFEKDLHPDTRTLLSDLLSEYERVGAFPLSTVLPIKAIRSAPVDSRTG
jgi:hypothetical protein